MIILTNFIATLVVASPFQIGASIAPNDFVDKQFMLLPVINNSGEKWPEQKIRMVLETEKAIAEELSAKSFTILPRTVTDKFLADAGVNLEDEESWKRDTFYELGAKSRSEFVCFAVITSATQRTRTNLFTTVPEGEVSIKCWILSAKDKKPIVSAKTFSNKARAKTNLFGEAKGSACQVDAAKRAVKDAVKEFLAGGR